MAGQAEAGLTAITEVVDSGLGPTVAPPEGTVEVGVEAVGGVAARQTQTEPNK